MIHFLHYTFGFGDHCHPSLWPLGLQLQKEETSSPVRIQHKWAHELCMRVPCPPGSDQYCISLWSWGPPVVHENSIPLCIIVARALHSCILRAPKETYRDLSGGNVLKDRRQIYPACLQHYKPVSHGDSLNYESALDKFSSVSLSKRLPRHPPQRDGVTGEGKDSCQCFHRHCCFPRQRWWGSSGAVVIKKQPQGLGL